MPGIKRVQHDSDLSSDGSPVGVLDASDEVLFDARQLPQAGAGASAASADSDDDEGDSDAGEGGDDQKEDDDWVSFTEDDELPLDPPPGVSIEEWARIRRLRLMSKTHIDDPDEEGSFDTCVRNTCTVLLWCIMLLALLNMFHVVQVGHSMPLLRRAWGAVQDAAARSWAYTRSPVHNHFLPVYDPQGRLPEDADVYNKYFHGSPAERRSLIDRFTTRGLDLDSMAATHAKRQAQAMESHRWTFSGEGVVSRVPVGPDAAAKSQAKAQEYTHAKLGHVRPRRQVQVQGEGVATAVVQGDGSVAQDPVTADAATQTPSPKPLDAKAAAAAFLARRAALMAAGLDAAVAEEVAAAELREGGAT